MSCEVAYFQFKVNANYGTLLIGFSLCPPLVCYALGAEIVLEIEERGGGAESFVARFCLP